MDYETRSHTVTIMIPLHLYLGFALSGCLSHLNIIYDKESGFVRSRHTSLYIHVTHHHLLLHFLSDYLSLISHVLPSCSTLCTVLSYYFPHSVSSYISRMYNIDCRAHIEGDDTIWHPGCGVLGKHFPVKQQLVGGTG